MEPPSLRLFFHFFCYGASGGSLVSCDVLIDGGDG